MAYREAARLALEDAGSVEGREMTSMTVTFPYLAMNDVMRLIKSVPASDAVKITNQEFDNTCTLTLSLPLDLVPLLGGKLEAVSGTSLNY